ncbi:hypothetical protein [Amycolatopsis sacchari]|uniref:hypothetical protein n=1 Tax=Amycolatopsis sacchari TaxID=115433 RepID=UPI003D740722
MQLSAGRRRGRAGAAGDDLAALLRLGEPQVVLELLELLELAQLLGIQLWRARPLGRGLHVRHLRGTGLRQRGARLLLGLRLRRTTLPLCGAGLRQRVVRFLLGLRPERLARPLLRWLGRVRLLWSRRVARRLLRRLRSRRVAWPLLSRLRSRRVARRLLSRLRSERVARPLLRRLRSLHLPRLLRWLPRPRLRGLSGFRVAPVLGLVARSLLGHPLMMPGPSRR